MGSSTMTARSGPSPTNPLEPEQSKQASPGAQKNKKKTKAPKPPPSPPQKLYQQLGHEMINKLVQDLQIPHDTPTLVDRLRDLGLISVQAAQTPSHLATTAPTQGLSLKATASLTSLSLDLIPHIIPPSSKPNSNVPKKSKAKDNHDHIFTLGDFAAGNDNLSHPLHNPSTNNLTAHQSTPFPH